MADAKPTFGRSVLLPSFLALVVFGVAALFLSTFLQDHATLTLGFGAAFVLFVTGRALAYFDVPRGYGLFARHLLTGTSIGFAGWAFLRGVFVEGPANWLLLGGFGFGLYRAHRALLKDARDKPDTGARWLRIFHPRDVQALVVLMTGYALVGVSGFFFLRGFGGFVPDQIVAIATAAYALHGARLLLGFAAEERGQAGSGVVHWLKANALQVAIVTLLLVAYAIFRDRLAVSVPFFPLVEFGLGMAVFGFVLARLRSKMRKDGTLLATASEARDHERVVSELREADYDIVARPVTRFIESGLGKEEYAQAVAIALDDARASDVRARVAGHREPPRAPALEMEWAFLAGAAMTAGLAVAAGLLGGRVFEAEMPYPLLLALLFVAFGTYAQQDVARSHHRPWLALGIAAAGTMLLFLDFVLFVSSVASLASVPGVVWGIVAGIAGVMLGIPALSAWKQAKRLRAGNVVDAKRLAPALEMQKELQNARKRAATMALAALIILLPAPWLAGWLAGRGIIPPDFPEFLDRILDVGLWGVIAFGGAALVRFYGLTRGRPALLAREKAKRDGRLALHRNIMQTIERS